jgi:YidC/Oxa1 family membrane protein insertase
MNFWDLIILNPMANVLLWIYSLLGNYGIAIIIFTIFIRLLTHPLTVKQIQSSQKMTDLQKSKEWLEIATKYKDDKQKQQMEQMRLMQENKVSLGGSCLPMLIQLPVIFGLYQSITLALAYTPLQMVNLSSHTYPFIDVERLLPIASRFLWMDLSQPERLVLFGIPIPVLAILVVITTYLQGKLMAPPSQPGDQSAQMTQAMNLYMPLFMGYLAFSFASGLSLYFIISNLFTVGQYAALGKLNWHNLIPGSKMPEVTRPSESKVIDSKSTAGKSSSSKSSSSKSGSGQSSGRKTSGQKSK